MKQEFLDNLDTGWGDAIADTYEDAANNEFIIQINGKDYETDEQIDIKIKADVNDLQMQAQFEVLKSMINNTNNDAIVNNTLIIIFPKNSTTLYYNNELIENIFNGMYFKFEVSRTANKNHCKAYINFVHTSNMNKNDISLFYIPYMKKHSCDLKVSDAFKKRVMNEYINNPYYDSLTKFDPADYKDKFDKHIYTVEYLLNQ